MRWAAPTWDNRISHLLILVLKVWKCLDVYGRCHHC